MLTEIFLTNVFQQGLIEHRHDQTTIKVAINKRGMKPVNAILKN